MISARGPYFDELTVGRRFADAPSITLTEGGAATHQAILGDRLRLPLDREASGRVTGRPGVAHPAYVWNVAIGQSTVATHHVRANLFYRGLVFGRAPYLGDTLTTVTEVVGLRENSRRPGRAATGLVGLHIVTRDQHGNGVLDFYRCAMLPLSDGTVTTEHADDLDSLGVSSAAVVSDCTADWDLSSLTLRGPVPRLVAGTVIEVVGGDVVSSAPELARLTGNVAQVHHDARAAGGRRLVYGGHTIGLALAQVARALPQVVTVIGWEGCDHVGPVHEGDTLRSTIEVIALRPRHADLRVRVTAEAPETRSASGGRDVLDWRFTALVTEPTDS
ncbi:MAG TPA: MaoC family dehydratase [Marmoricola sp.]|jgi:acyl dehydratase|nr:MaoC family dehydratase [Marmoricola sp.]